MVSLSFFTRPLCLFSQPQVPSLTTKPSNWRIREEFCQWQMLASVAHLYAILEPQSKCIEINNERRITYSTGGNQSRRRECNTEKIACAICRHADLCIAPSCVSMVLSYLRSEHQRQPVLHQHGGYAAPVRAPTSLFCCC